MPARRKAVIVHLNDFLSVTPLVGGYLKAYALQDPEIRASWDIELYNAYVGTPASRILNDLHQREPALIGFSVYTWNVGLVMRLHAALRHVLPPSTRYLLGGVEVMHLGKRFLQPAWEDTLICNGEGEKTFLEVLRELNAGGTILHEVNGLSLYRDGELITTPPNPRIRHLNEIPSPWLTGMFSDDDLSEVALFETNRGCPYACEFCYWGGAIGQRVTKIEVERIKEELTYIADHGTKVLAFCDANIGILPHDVEIAEHVAALRRNRRAPTRVILNSAKNRIDRVEKIARIYMDAGMLSTQAISLQSTNPAALEQAKRINRSEDYLQMMDRLNADGIPTFIELIWPMPGETLESFKTGIDELIIRGAPAFFIHPLQWLNNVGFHERRAELGIATLGNDDPLSGTENVIATREVSYPQYQQGLLTIAALLLLHTCRGLYTTMHLLSRLQLMRHRDVLDDFADWMQTRTDGPVSGLWHDGRIHFEKMCKSLWPGIVMDSVLRVNRQSFTELVQDYADQRLLPRLPTAHVALIQAAVEYDHLTRPYLYLVRDPNRPAFLEHLSVESARRGVLQVRSPYDFTQIDLAVRRRQTLPPAALAPADWRITIDHRNGSVMPLPGWQAMDYHWFATGAVRAILRHAPRCTAATLDGETEGARAAADTRARNTPRTEAVAQPASR